MPEEDGPQPHLVQNKETRCILKSEGPQIGNMIPAALTYHFQGLGNLQEDEPLSAIQTTVYVSRLTKGLAC